MALGLVLLLARPCHAENTSRRSAGAGLCDGHDHLDAIVHLHAAHIDKSCWQGIAPRENPARLIISLAIGRWQDRFGDLPAGGSATMRSCVESYVKTYFTCRKAGGQAMIVPIEVAR